MEDIPTPARAPLEDLQISQGRRAPLEDLQISQGSSPSSAPGRVACWSLRLVTWGGLALGLVLLLRGIPAAGTPGTDECMHAVGSLRLALLLVSGDLHGFWMEFHKPEYYTPLGRLGMGLGFLHGPGFDGPRAATALAWILTIVLSAPLARRVAPAGQRDQAVFWTFLMALTCWLGVSYSRGTYLEAWSALITVSGVLLYLRARSSSTRPYGSWGWAFACGLWLGVALLVKYTYGIFLLGAVGLSGLVDLIHRPAGVRPLRVALGVGAGTLAMLLWWFVLPLPMGLEYGAMHRETFIRYLTKAADLDTLGPEFLLVVWPLKACLSLPIFALQLVGVAYGLRHWREPGCRLCAALVVIASLGFLLYPFRIDRFVLPTLFGAWVLGGVVAARLVARAPRGLPRLVAGLSLLSVLILSRGVGSARLVQLAMPQVEELSQELMAETQRWTRPYEHRAAPASGPPGMHGLLETACRHLNPREPFLWIGGTGTELPPILIDWALFQTYSVKDALFPRRPELIWFWEEPGLSAGKPWTMEQFHYLASIYPQVGLLDPPDPKGRPREFEQRYVEWMKSHPDFELAAQEPVLLGGEEFSLRFYRKRP